MSNFTKIAIQQSFLRLLSQRSITKITVKDIVEDCGINRNSFYYHFQDLPQLLETVIIESADEIISRIPESFSLEEGLTTVLERLVENKRAIRNIWASPDRAFYEQNLMRVCNYVVSRYIACRSVDLLRTLPEYLRTLCHLDAPLEAVGSVLPLASLSLGWVCPAALGLILGLVIHFLRKTPEAA